MKKILAYFENRNLYGIFFKLVGFGFQLIGLSLMFKDNYPVIYIAEGMSVGLIFIGVGEIINLLDKILNKEK